MDLANEKTKAKKIFFDFACNHFYMQRDGVEEEYERFGITSKEEAEWRKEYIEFWVERLSVDDLQPVNRITEASAGEALPDLLKMADKGDSYAKLRYSNAIWQLAMGADISLALKNQTAKMSVRLWQSIVEEPFQLTEKHQEEISALLNKYKSLTNASTPQEYILNYAKSKLAEAREKGFAR